MDLTGKFLNFFGSLDIISACINDASGFIFLEYSGDYDSALAYKQKLERDGVPCRLEGGGLFNACVYTRGSDNPSPASRSQANEVQE